MADDFENFTSSIRNSAIIRDNILIRDYSAKETVLIESESSTQVYFILSGKVKVTSFHANGKEVWHAALLEGLTFGEMAAINDVPRTATIETLEKSKIGILPKNHFLNALEIEPGVALFFLRDMASRLQTTTLHSSERIALLMPSRICAELLRQAKEHSPESEIIEVHSDLTVTTLAQRLNANRETVSRTISALIEEKCIKKVGRQFLIIDKNALIRRAEG